MKTSLLSTALLLACTAFGPAFGEAFDGFPESADIRSTYWAGFFSAPEKELQRRAAATVSNEYGSFRLSVARSGGYFYAIAAAIGTPLPGRGGTPLYTQGSWILKRSSPDGRPIQAKVFLRSDPGTFIRIYPDGDRSKLDLVVYGGVLNREVPLPVPFERVFASTMAEIASWTESLVDWSLFAPEAGMYRDIRAFVAETRRRLPSLRYVEDGALDAEGRPVQIATLAPQAGLAGLNCSGFAAWVADGFYRPLTGGLLDPKALAARHEEARATAAAGPYETDLDPFFGLDWTRNIAKALLDARYTSRPHDLTESDVRISPFALVASSVALGSPGAVNGSSAYRAYPAYQRDLGYETAGLKALMYVLALREPGSIYLASVSRKSGGAIPGLSRHYHVAVLAPYFEETGEFKVAAFESDAETSVEAIMARVPNDYVHLVRIRAERDYDPPVLPRQ
ncbi:MAG: hypothetical protein ABSF43_10400 [Rectinemataceae bacterium]|jgi:hypothetical protein